MQNSNFFHINEEKFKQLEPLFEDVYSAYANTEDTLHRVAVLKLLAAFYSLKEELALISWPERYANPQHVLFGKFMKLVDNFYINKRTVDEYADLLCVTPNHLSQSIKSETGKNALSFINERLVKEAKSLIQYTDMDIAEIAYQLNFPDPANFGKFFKRLAGSTPLEF